MTAVSLGYSRVSSALQYNRSYTSLALSSSLMAKYEQQINTQLRYQHGSDAPSYAAMTQTTQMLIERKAQNSTNLKSAQSYLTAGDSALSQIGGLVSDSRSAGLDAINTITSDSERTALAQTVKSSLQQIVNFGNTSYLNRYLFSGSETDKLPFSWDSNAYALVYSGNTGSSQTWTDTGLLSSTGLSGAEVFGAISDPIASDVDYNPAISPSTRLADLNGGDGGDKGSIRLVYANGRSGGSTVDIDLSDCHTVDDVRAAIVKNAPPGAKVDVELTDNGLAITLADSASGTLSIEEVGKGTVARQLGIRTKTPITAGSTFVGGDLNPAVTALTSLDDLFGSRARLALTFDGDNNNILLEAKQNGEAVVDPETGEEIWPLNGIEVVFQAETATTPGSEWVEFDEESRRLTVHIHPDGTNANNVISAINSASEAGTIPPFIASLDSLNTRGGSGAAGTGLINLLPDTPYTMGTTAYGSGQAFDKTSGIQIVNANTTHTVDFSDCSTVSELLAVLNDPALGLYATINASGTGLDVSTRVNGTDFMIGENGGTTASQLGIRSLCESTRLDELDFGRGVMDYEGPGTNAQAFYESKSANSGLLLTAKNEGPDWNDFQMEFYATDDPDGEVLITWDEAEKTIRVGINPGVTTACSIVEAFAKQPGPQEYFTLELDTSGGPNTGLGVVYAGSTTTAGGVAGGTDFSITRHDGVRFSVDINGASTIDDVLRIINEHPGNTGGLLTARLSEYGNGIELVDASVGTQATRIERELLSTAAIDLGLIPRGEESATQTTDGTYASVTLGAGMENASLFVSGKSTGNYANDVRVEIVDMNAPGGSGEPRFTWDSTANVLRFEIDPGTTTAAELIELYQTQGSAAVRNLYDIQNGANPDGSAGDGSGAVVLTDPSDVPALSGGSDARLLGTDPNPLEAESLFNAMIRLQIAMENNDEREIERATNQLDAGLERVNLARTEIGTRQTGLDAVATKLENEYVQHRQALADYHEIDMAETTLGYMTQSLAYEANLMIASQLFQMSLMNYL